MANPGDKEEALIALAWYQPDQWKRLREISADADTLEDTYEEWLDFASRSFAELRGSGPHIRIIVVDVEELVKWCRARRIPVDAEARADFVAEKAAEQSGSDPERGSSTG